MDVTIRIDDAAVVRGFERFPERMTAAVDAAIWRGGEEIARSEKRAAPKAFTTLTNSIRVDRLAPMHVRVATGVNYARPVEEGRAPGKMPGTSNGLMEWVKQKTGQSGKELDRTAFIIARAIGRKGIKPARYAERTVETEGQRVIANVQAAARRAAQEFGRV